VNAIALTRSQARVVCFGSGTAPYNEDPLDDDTSEDAAVTTSRRGLTRLALVAAETGARFQREEVGHDPMAWMLAPRQLFEGATALEACLQRDNCLRAILLHGLSIGLDCSPAAIDALLTDAPDDYDPKEPWTGRDRGGPMSGYPGSRRMRLYTATIVLARGGELLHAFHASVAPSVSVVRERLRARLGSAAAAQAEIRVGYDPDCPASIGMVPPAIMDTLTGTGRRTRWSEFAGLDVTVEQRIPS
jgi:hypothetical protein